MLADPENTMNNTGDRQDKGNKNLLPSAAWMDEEQQNDEKQT